MARYRCVLLCTALTTAALFMSGFAVAEQEREIRPGDIDPAQIVLTHPDMPERGTTKSQVRAALGAPGKKVPPVGEPPISRWIYDEFIVYFERNRVLHSVIPGGRRANNANDS